VDILDIRSVSADCGIAGHLVDERTGITEQLNPSLADMVVGDS